MRCFIKDSLINFLVHFSLVGDEIHSVQFSAVSRETLGKMLDVLEEQREWFAGDKYQKEKERMGAYRL